ncbi:MAG: rhomboid family intramembrane serine protease [Parvularculaceae bacterium]
MFNMMTLFFFGPDVERLLGTDGFLVVYLGAVMTSGIVCFYVNRKNPAYTSIGASDGVSGVVLSFCLFFPFKPIYFMFVPVPIPAILYGIFFVVLSAGMMGRGGRISHESHLAGAAAGVILTILMKPAALLQYFA